MINIIIRPTMRFGQNPMIGHEAMIGDFKIPYTLRRP